MVDYRDYWMDRVGQVGGATVTSTHPEPLYGAAFDIGTGNLTMREYVNLVNDTEAVYHDQEAIERHGWWGKTQEFAGMALGTGVSWIGDRISDVDDATKNALLGVLPDTFVDAAYDARSTAASGIGAGLKWFDENVQEPWFRAIASVAHASNIADEKADNSWEAFFAPALFEGDTWSEAWKRAEYTTFGQAVAEDVMFDDEEREGFYASGFDPKTGLPKSAAYRDIRLNDPTFNLLSGTLDFAKSWFLDPGVIVGKGARVARAFQKADLQRMPPRMRQRFFTTVTAPADEFEKIKADRRRLDPVTNRAIRVRENVNQLRDRIRQEDLTVSQVAEMQAFETAANGPTAAHAFVNAAKARRLDESGVRMTDEYDEDLFDTTFAAMMGHVGAKARLAERRDEIGDAMRALREETLPAMERAVERAEVRYRFRSLDLQLSWGKRNTQNFVENQALARMEVDDYLTAVREREHAEEALRGYEGFDDWMTQAISDVHVTMAPQEAYSVGQRLRYGTASSYRPTSHSKVSASIIKVPNMFFRAQAGVADLHRPGDSYRAGKNYLDQAVALADDAVEEIAQERGFVNFAEMREKLLTDLAGAATDTDRRSLLMLVERVGFDSVVRRHKLSTQEADELIDELSTMRRNLITQMHRQAQETGDNRTFKIADATGNMTTHRLPVTLTQLENYHIAADLKVLNTVLKRHGDSVRAILRRKVGTATDYGIGALSAFNHYWKPGVLLRLGYPLRTMTDEALRVIAITGSMGSMMENTKALSAGLRNVRRRAFNKTRRAFSRYTMRELRFRYPSMMGFEGPEAINDALGNVDVPDPTAMDRLLRRTKKVDDWVQQDLHARANGRDLRVQAPKYVRDVQDRLTAFAAGDDEFLALSAQTMRPARQGGVIAAPYEGVRTVEPELNAQTLIQFIKRHADVLSNPRARVLLRKTDQGVELDIGFRVPKAKAAVPMRQVVFLDNAGRSLHESPEAAREIPLVRQVGEEPLRHEGLEVEGAFGPSGRFMRAANSSAPSQAHLHRGYEYNISEGRRRAAGHSKTLTPRNGKDYAREWHRQIVDIVQPDPLMRRILDDWEDEEILAWLRGQDVRGSSGRAGRKVARRLPEEKAENLDRYLVELRLLLDSIVPTESLRARILNDDDIRQIELEELMHTPGAPIPQAIDGVVTELTVGRGGLRDWINEQIGKAFNALATLPTDVLIRNPFFVTNYNDAARQMLSQAEAERLVVTPEIKAAIESSAREHALNQTQRYLFSLAETTEFTHMIRFLSPFAAAWQETMVKWFRIFTERPESFARLFMNGWEDLHELYGVQVVDQNGNLDENGEFVIVPFPGPVKEVVEALPGIDEGDLDNMGTLSIPKDSLNITLQGDPFWLPGPGPIMQLPSKWLLENSPHLADENEFSKFLWSWLFPIGVPRDEFEAISPAWINQVRRRWVGTKDPRFQNLAMSIWTDEMHKWRAEGQIGQQPSFTEATEKAEGVQLLYTLGRIGMPFSFQVQPETQMFIDMARKYQKEYGWQDGLTRFTQEVGDDAYLFWTSSSKPNIDVPPTASGFKGYRRWQDQIERWPELAGMFVGLEAAEDEFAYSVYAAQQRMPVAPHDPRPQRGQKTPEERIREIEALQGWQEYRDFKNRIQAELGARGLRSIQQADAQDLQLIQRAFIDQQRHKLPGWGVEYDQRDIGRNYRLVDAMRQAVSSGNYPDRPDWLGIEEYVQLHDTFAAELDARGLIGGSRDITAESNSDLEALWEVAVGDLVSRNLQFADIYYRYLDGHKLTDGSH